MQSSHAKPVTENNERSNELPIETRESRVSNRGLSFRFGAPKKCIGLAGTTPGALEDSRRGEAFRSIKIPKCPVLRGRQGAVSTLQKLD